ncbi:uncharacterized protein [Procambarus clarkii]|uniref:uncharacterized protein n=1 Tax=Procambarus clarkii TaxID=6728 RepID=UPI003743F8B4
MNTFVITVSEMEASLEKELALKPDCSVVCMSSNPDGSVLVVADNQHNITAFSLDQDSSIMLPSYNSPVTAIGVHPTTQDIVVVHADMMIKEYDLTKQKYTPFCREFLSACCSDLSKRNSVIHNVSYDPLHTHLILLHDDSSIIVLDKQKLTAKEKLGKPGKVMRYEEKLNDGNCKSSNNGRNYRTILFFAKAKNTATSVRASSIVIGHTNEVLDISAIDLENLETKMMRKALFILILATAKGQMMDLFHSDLVALDAACSTEFFCNGSDYQSAEYCMCDDLCAKYGDCCPDSVHYRREDQVLPERYKCVSTNNGKFYMKSVCMSGWEDEEVAQLCLAGSRADISSSRDPLAHLPATSNTTSVTYTNYYCAICNNDSHDLTLWKTQLECVDNEEYFPDQPDNYIPDQKDNYIPDQPDNYIPDQPDNYIPYQPDNYIPYQPDNYIPDQPDNYIPDQPDYYIPDQPDNYIPYQPDNYISYQPDNYIPYQPDNYIPDQPGNLSEYITSHLLFDNGSWGAFVPFNGKQIFKKCNINIKIPDIPFPTRKCDSTINTCAKNWTDASVAALCHSYTAVRIYSVDVAYRNPHCLLCNWKSISSIYCGIAAGPGPPSFSLLIDFGYHSGGNNVGIVNLCQPDEVYDNFLNKCRNVSWGNISQVDKEDKGHEGDNKVTINTSDFSACCPHNTRKAFRSNLVSTESNETLNCDKILLSEGEFTLNEKRMVIVEAYARSYQVGEYEVTEGGVLVCKPQELSHKFSSVLGWVSLVGLGLSCLCLLLHLAAFLLVPHLRNLPGMCLACLCLSLLTAYTIFIFSTFLEPKTTGCYISAVIMYYSFLAAFCWMNIMAFDVWLTFRQAKDELRVSSGKQRSKFLFYCVYGWLLPALAVVVTVTLDMTAPAGLSPQFLPSFGQRWCWFGKRKALLVFFGAPLFTVMALNVVFFLMTSYTIGTSTQSTLQKSSSPQDKKQFVLYVRLAVLMGLTWITGIVAGYLQLQAIWYVFVVLNTLQGTFIFLTFTCRSKVWRDVQERCRSCLQQVYSHPGSHTSSSGSG